MVPRVIIIAGPNGAGKTTFASEFLPHEAACPQFLNADLIANGLSPFDFNAAAMRAGKLMLTEINRCVKARESFSFETALSGRAFAQRIPNWQAVGYRVDLIFLSLSSIRLAIARVKERVAQGGHHVPAKVIRRRFHSGMLNLRQLYQPLVDHWELYDNSGLRPVLLSEGDKKWTARQPRGRIRPHEVRLPL